MRAAPAAAAGWRAADRIISCCSASAATSRPETAASGRRGRPMSPPVSRGSGSSCGRRRSAALGAPLRHCFCCLGASKTVTAVAGQCWAHRPILQQVMQCCRPRSKCAGNLKISSTSVQAGVSIFLCARCINCITNATMLISAVGSGERV